MRIRNAKGRKDGNSGYTRLFNNAALGQLLSRVQATVISNGCELERLILEQTNNIENLDVFIDDVTTNNKPDGVYVCKKRTLKNSRLTIKNHEPDLLVFVVQQKRVCKIIELKDGDAFDTKKSRGEQEQLEEFAIKFGAKIPFVTDYYICCFNQENKETIKTGFKNVFETEHIMTGRELCSLLGISYDNIIMSRQKDVQDNFNYFVDELLSIPEIKKEINS